MALPDRDRARDIIRHIGALFIAERERLPLWLPVLLGIGIGVYFWVPSEPPRWLGVALLALAALLMVAAWRQGRALIGPSILLTVALGFAAAQLQAALVAAPVLERRLGPVMVEGRLEAVDPLPEGA